MRSQSIRGLYRSRSPSPADARSCIALLYDGNDLVYGRWILPAGGSHLRRHRRLVLEADAGQRPCALDAYSFTGVRSARRGGRASVEVIAALKVVTIAGTNGLSLCDSTLGRGRRLTSESADDRRPRARPITRC